MRILHVINNLGSGGAEKLLTDILPEMKNKGHEIFVLISNKKRSLEKYHTILLNSGIQIVDLNVSFYNPVQILKIAKFVIKNKLDIIHAHLFPTQYWLAFASVFFSRKVKLIKTEHNVFNRRQNLFFGILESFVYSRYSKIIAITESVKENLPLKLKNTGKIEVIKNGVNLKQINKEILLAKVEDYVFLNPGNFNVLMVGRLTINEKDHLALFKAMSLLEDNFHLFLAGEGPDEKFLQQKAQELGIRERVHFLGIRTDIYKLMSLVDLNILSTNYEGLSGVALESLASGKPFIGTNVAGVCDVVPDSSYLFPKKDPKELADKITELNKDADLRKTMIKKALNYVKDYGQQEMVNKYLNLYKSVLN